MSIAEQVKELREFEIGWLHDVPMAKSIMCQAADTIESLSAKLQTTNKELSDAKEVIKKLLCSGYSSSCQFCIHDEDNNAICCNIGGSGSWCCENAKWNGKIE